jgi:hypothetical protein
MLREAGATMDTIDMNRNPDLAITVVSVDGPAKDQRARYPINIPAQGHRCTIQLPNNVLETPEFRKYHTRTDCLQQFKLSFACYDL